MYTIIQAGGRQVKVAPGATVELDGRAAEAGKEVVFDQVLLLARTVVKFMPAPHS